MKPNTTGIPNEVLLSLASVKNEISVSYASSKEVWASKLDETYKIARDFFSIGESASDGTAKLALVVAWLSTR